MIKLISKVLCLILIFNLIVPINVQAETLDNVELAGESITADGSVVTGNNITTTYTKTITETKPIYRRIRVARDESEDSGGCSGSSTYDYIEYTAYVTQNGKVTYIMPGHTITAGMSFPLEVYYEADISYTIDITSVPRFQYGYKSCRRKCSGTGENRSCHTTCSCKKASTYAVEYASYHAIPNYGNSSKNFYGLNTEYTDGSFTPLLPDIWYGDTSSETARQLAEVDMQSYLSEINNNINTSIKNNIKISYPDSNTTDSNYQVQGNQIRYTSWKKCEELIYTQTDGSEAYYTNRQTSESYFDRSTWMYRWKRDLGWKEGRKAYTNCTFYLNNSYINRTDGNVIYSSNTDYSSNNNYLSTGLEIFTPLDMKTGVFPVNIQINNLGLLSVFNSSKWDINDTININVVQKYYNEISNNGGASTSYDGYSFYYRPIALSTKNGGVYSLDPFPTNNYIPANFIKWLYINGEIGDGSSSSAGLSNRNNQYQKNWQRLTQDYLNGKMSSSTAEYYVDLTRTLMSSIQENYSDVSYLNNSLRSNGYSEFVERYRNYINRNDEPSNLGEVKTEDWQVLLRK